MAVDVRYAATALFLAACTSYDAGELVGRDVLQQGQVAPDRVDNGDGTYSLTIAPEDVPVEPLVSGAVTFQYSGQAAFAYGPPGATPGQATIGGQRPSPYEEMYDTVRVDSLGRRWTVSDVDRDLLCEVTGQPLEDCDVDDIPAATPVETGEWIPQSWSRNSCTVNVGGTLVLTEETVYATDGRDLVGANFTTRQKPTVALFYAPQGDFAGTTVDFACSAMVVRPHFILTAAHCVTHPVTRAELAPNEFQVCTLGNRYSVAGESTCTHAVSIDVNPTGWTANEELGWDLAVVEVVADLESHVGRYNLSDALPATIEDATLHMTGYPLPEKGCDGTSNVLLSGTQDPDLNAPDLYHQIGLALDADPHVVKTRMESAPGHSGGPIYICGADGSCQPNDLGWAVAVWSGFFNPDQSVSLNTGDEWAGGASIPGHRNWILGKL